jgi:hypothetical protein
LAGLLCGLLVFEHLSLPISLTDARVPEVYQTIAADPAPVSVLQVPLGWRNSFGAFGPEETLLQYYQTVSDKPILGGNISRAPDFKLDYFERIPLFKVLRDIQFHDEPDPAQVEAAKAQAADLMYLYNTGYVLLYPPIPGRPPYSDNWQAAWNYVKATLPLEAKPFWAKDGIEAYRVIQPAGKDSFHLDLGAPATYAYRGEGWEETETGTIYDASAIWGIQDSTAPSSRLFIPLRHVEPSAIYSVTMQLHPFAYPGSPQQSVTLSVNGAPFATRLTTPDWQTVSWQIPGSVLINGLNRLELAWGYSAIPRKVLGGDRAIGKTGVQLPLDAALTAFADGGYIALFDDQGTQSDGSAGRKGVNVTVIDPGTGEVLDKQGFDTTASSNESVRLATFLNAIPAGQIILVATYGDAWNKLKPEATMALQEFGIDVTPEMLRGKYLAAAGVQGASPGSGAVVLDDASAFLQITLDRDRRNLAAAVDWVDVGREK